MYSSESRTLNFFASTLSILKCTLNFRLTLSQKFREDKTLLFICKHRHTRIRKLSRVLTHLNFIHFLPSKTKYLFSSPKMANKTERSHCRKLICNLILGMTKLLSFNLAPLISFYQIKQNFENLFLRCRSCPQSCF